MQYLLIDLFFLAIFWIGVFTLSKIKIDKFDLKERIESYVGSIRKNKSPSGSQRFTSRIRTELKKEKYADELSRALAYVKNIAILGHAGNISAQTLLEELSDISDELKPVFLSMAHYLNLNDRASAEDCLGKTVGTSAANDIGRFLAGWEDLPPKDILHSIELYQSTIREEKITAQKRRDEIISDIVYFPVVVNCMAVLMNFVYVAYFIEQKEMIEMLFL